MSQVRVRYLSAFEQQLVKIRNLLTKISKFSSLANAAIHHRMHIHHIWLFKIWTLKLKNPESKQVAKFSSQNGQQVKRRWKMEEAYKLIDCLREEMEVVSTIGEGKISSRIEVEMSQNFPIGQRLQQQFFAELLFCFFSVSWYECEDDELYN